MNVVRLPTQPIALILLQFAATMPPAPSPQQQQSDIPLLIQQLGDPLFATRQAAMQRLQQAGAPAVEPLARAVQQGDPEQRLRGLVVLKRIALQDDALASALAEEQILQLASSPLPAVARNAAAVVSELQYAFERRAAGALERLGANIYHASRVVGGLSLNVATQLTLDEQWKGTPQDLEQIRRLRNLEFLLLSGPQIDDRLIQQVAELPALSRLVVKRAPISSDAFLVLGQGRRLLDFEIYYCQIDDGSVDYLGRMKWLQTLKLYGTRISQQGIDRLQVSLPTSEIDFRRGGFLGVQFLENGGPCQLTRIVPESAAERAGLQQDDIIVGFDGKEIQTVEDFRAQIYHTDVGETVELKVTRDGQTLRFTATLGEYE